MGGGAGVHDPARVLERHLVQGGNEAGLIPHRCWWRCSEVRLRVGAHEPLVTPALGIWVLPARARALQPVAMWRRTALGGPGGVAEPGHHGAVAPVLLTATAALLPGSAAALLPATLAAPGTLLAALALLASP